MICFLTTTRLPMRFSVLFLMLSLLCKFGWSQVVTVSEEISLRTDASYEIIGKMKGQHLLFYDKETSFEIIAFDSDLRKKWDKELELDKRRPDVLGIDRLQDTIYLVYEFKERGHTILKAHRYDAGANLKDSVTIKDYGFQFTAPNFQIIRSEDRSKVLVWYIEDNDKINALSFDVKNMELLWDTTIKPEDFILGRDINQFLVDNDGGFHLMIQKHNFRSKSKIHHYEVYYYDQTLSEPSINIIPLEGNLTYDAYFSYDNLNDQLVCGGLYSEKNKVWAKGYFLMSIPDDNPEEYSLYFKPFEDELAQNYLEKDANKKNRGIYESAVQEIVLRRDGGILMVVERTKTTQRAYGTTANYVGARNTYSTLTDYYFEHLLVISIHPDGELHWADVLRKKQFSQDDFGAYSSYFLMKTPANLRFIFNDEIKEENTVSEYILEGSGLFERNSVMSTDNQKLRLRFRVGIQIGADEFLVPSERRNRLKLVRVRY